MPHLFALLAPVAALLVSPGAAVRQDNGISAADLGQDELEAGGPKPVGDRERQMMEAYGLAPSRKTKTRAKRRPRTAANGAPKFISDGAPKVVPTVPDTPRLVAKQRPAAPKKQIVEEEEDAPEDLIDIDPCCIADSDPVSAEASAEGTYTITVKHPGLSLSASGQPYSCTRAQTSMSLADVEYVCPQQCFVDPLEFNDFVALLTSNPDGSVADVEACEKNACKGQCYNTHDSDWTWRGAVSIEAPRLKGCAVKGGGNKGLFVMTSNCARRFEDWRQDYWAVKG